MFVMVDISLSHYEKFVEGHASKSNVVALLTKPAEYDVTPPVLKLFGALKNQTVGYLQGWSGTYQADGSTIGLQYMDANYNRYGVMRLDDGSPVAFYFGNRHAITKALASGAFPVDYKLLDTPRTYTVDNDIEKDFYWWESLKDHVLRNRSTRERWMVPPLADKLTGWQLEVWQKLKLSERKSLALKAAKINQDGVVSYFMKMAGGGKLDPSTFNERDLTLWDAWLQPAVKARLLQK